MDDDEDYDFDAIDKLEINALASRQATNLNFAQPATAAQQSYPAYQPLQHNGYVYEHRSAVAAVQQPWERGALSGHVPPIAPPQWHHSHTSAAPQPPSLTAPTGHQYHNQHHDAISAPRHLQQQQPHNNGGAALHQSTTTTIQNTWQAPPLPHQPPPPQQQSIGAWQPPQRVPSWQPPPPPLPPPAPSTSLIQPPPSLAYPHHHQQQQQQLSHQSMGSYAQQQQFSRPQARPPLAKPLNGGGWSTTTTSTTTAAAAATTAIPHGEKAQRDLLSLWGVNKHQTLVKGNNAPLQQHQNRNQRGGGAAAAAAGGNALHYQNQNNYPTTAATSDAVPCRPAHVPNTLQPPPTRTTATTASDANTNITNDMMMMMECQTTTGCLRVSHEAAQHWIYPAGVPERAYQVSAITTALLSNTLVCLPTGLGKTFIAAVVMQNFTRWFPESKVVFVAPTKPLVSQQIEACRRFMGLAPDATAELTGRIKSDERKALWHDPQRRVFFCTPQTFYNDVKLAVCPYDAISCVVVDECHRATGQSEIAQTLKLMQNKYKLKFRVLGLSATPGSSAEQVQEVITNTGAAAMHFRTNEDPDVAPYVYQKITEVMVVDAAAGGGGRGAGSNSSPRALLLATLQRLVGHLAGARCYFGSADAERVSRFGLMQAQMSARENPTAAGGGGGVGGVIGGVPPSTANEWFRQAAVLADVRDSFDRYGERPAAALLKTKLAEERCMKYLHTKEPFFAQFLKSLTDSVAAGGGGPRLAKLVSVLRAHFEADEQQGGVIIFASLRDGVQNIVEALQQHAPLIRAKAFIGQGSGGGGGGSGSGGPPSSRSSKSAGMNQKAQKDAIKGFSNGDFNVLVATCIGEEGLDIPAVDLIVCYDATASPTRAVQRQGRTGRHREGRVVYILGAGREEEQYYKIQEATTRLHSQLRNAERFFEMAKIGPRLLPRQLTPQRKDEDLGGAGGGVAGVGEEEKSKRRSSGGGRGGRGSRGGGRGGSKTKGRGSRLIAAAAATTGTSIDGVAAEDTTAAAAVDVPGVAAAVPPKAKRPVVMALLEAGGSRLSKEGPRYPPRAPPSPPPSQPGATPFDSQHCAAAGPHTLLFPETSKVFIRPGSNGRRLAIAPPPLDIGALMAAAAAASVAVAATVTVENEEIIEQGKEKEKEKTAAVTKNNNNQAAPHTPPARLQRLRFLPEFSVCGGSITLPCGLILKSNESTGSSSLEKGGGGGQIDKQHSPWAFLAAAIARPPHLDQNLVVRGGGGGGGGKKRKTLAGSNARGRGRGRVVVARPTQPSAPLAVADIVADLLLGEHQQEDDGGKNCARLIACSAEKSKVDDHGDNDDEEQRENGDDDVDDELLFEAVGGGGTVAENGGIVTVHKTIDDVIDLVSCGEDEDEEGGHRENNGMDEDGEDDIIHSSSQRPLAARLHDLHQISTAAAALSLENGRTSINDREEKEEEDLPLAKRLKMVQQQQQNNGPTAAAAAADPIRTPLSEGGGIEQQQQQQQHCEVLDGADGPCFSYGNDWFEGDDDGDDDDGLWEGWDQAGGVVVGVQGAADVHDDDVDDEMQQKDWQVKDTPPSFHQHQHQQHRVIVYRGGGGGVRRRAIIMTQSQDDSQQQHQQQAAPLPSAQPSLPFTDGSLPVTMNAPPTQPKRLTRLKKAGTRGGGGGGGPPRLQHNSNHHSAPLQQQQHQEKPKKQNKSRGGGGGNGGSKTGAHRFFDTEAQLSGDDDEHGDEDEEGGAADAYESDFIDDGSGQFNKTPIGGGGGGELHPSAPHAAFQRQHHHFYNNINCSPSPGELLRRLQRARLGRRGNGSMDGGASGGGGGISQPDEYDREDSFIDDDDDGDGDEQEGDELGFDTPAGRDSHDDVCGGCGGEVGELLLCDACPAAFHLGCVGLAVVPVGDWFCPLCVNGDGDARRRFDDASAAGRRHHTQPHRPSPSLAVVVGVKKKFDGPKKTTLLPLLQQKHPQQQEKKKVEKIAVLYDSDDDFLDEK